MYTYPIDALMQWDGRRVTDHNRSALNVSYESIESSGRTVNGTLRKFVVARKRTFKIEWVDLFNTDSTVDGFMGADAIDAFYNSTPGDFILTITDGSGKKESARVMIKDYSKSLSKRGKRTDFYDISISLEEV